MLLRSIALVTSLLVATPTMAQSDIYWPDEFIGVSNVGGNYIDNATKLNLNWLLKPTSDHSVKDAFNIVMFVCEFDSLKPTFFDKDKLIKEHDNTRFESKDFLDVQNKMWQLALDSRIRTAICRDDKDARKFFDAYGKTWRGPIAEQVSTQFKLDTEVENAIAALASTFVSGYTEK